jgi:glycosyltransferase involved in cell wall biosynthesis
MKILVLNWLDRANPSAGGAEAHLHEIFGRLASRGHSVTLLASGWPGGAPRETLDGIDVHRAGGRYTYGLAAPRYHRRHLRREGDFDVVVEDLNKVPLFSPFWTDVPVVLVVHHLFGGTAFQEASLPVAALTWLLERPVPRAFRGVPVAAVSRSTADDLVRRGIPEEEIRVIPNGIDLGRYAPDPAVGRFPEPSLLYLGRLKRYKRIDLVIDAVARLRDRNVFARLRIVGKGDHRPKLEALVDRLDLRDRVDFLGFVSEEEKLELLRRSWIHLLTSPKEGWGIANLEAAACGTLTIASDSPGLRDSVRDGVTGVLVGHGDREALVGTIAYLIADESERERMSREARRFAEGYSWDESATTMERLLLERMAEGREAR